MLKNRTLINQKILDNCVIIALSDIDILDYHYTIEIIIFNNKKEFIKMIYIKKEDLNLFNIIRDKMMDINYSGDLFLCQILEYEYNSKYSYEFIGLR